jgi:hypothetical protein
MVEVNMILWNFSTFCWGMEMTLWNNLI